MNIHINKLKGKIALKKKRKKPRSMLSPRTENSADLRKRLDLEDS